MSSKVPYRIAVLGAGAVGGFYGALLQKSGNEVFYFSRSFPKTSGKRRVFLKSVWGDFEIDGLFFNTTKAMPPADLAVVSCKALPGIDYKELLEPVLQPNTVILVLQNGLNREERLHEVFPDHTIVAGSAFTCINRISAEEIHHIDYGSLQIAPFLSTYSNAAGFLEEKLKEANIPVTYVENHRVLRWSKLAWNIPFNSLSVLLSGADTSEMIESESALNVIRDLLQETLLIAGAEGCSLSEDLAEEMIKETGKMKPYKTSMLLDYENGGEMEVEAILGEPLKSARDRNVSTPVLKTVYGCMRFLNRQPKK